MIVVAALVVLLVGISRIYLGVHAPTDVLGGWALGTLWVLGVLAAEGQRWDLRPPQEAPAARVDVVA